MEKGRDALAVMDNHLKNRFFFVDDRFSIADIALYAYTHVADEGGFDLSPFENIAGWLKRIANQAGHVPITKDDFEHTD